MSYTAAIFFLNQQAFDDAFLLYSNERSFLGYPFLRYEDGNIRGTMRQHDEYPCVLLEIESLRQRPPKAAEHLIYEMLAVEMDSDTANQILEGNDGRNQLMRHNPHFFLEIGHVPTGVPVGKNVQRRTVAA